MDSGDVTRVVTEEDASERGEGAHEIGFPGDGSLNARDVTGGGQMHIVEGHGCLLTLLSSEMRKGSSRSMGYEVSSDRR